MAVECNEGDQDQVERPGGPDVRGAVRRFGNPEAIVLQHLSGNMAHEIEVAFAGDVETRQKDLALFRHRAGQQLAGIDFTVPGQVEGNTFGALKNGVPVHGLREFAGGQLLFGPG